MTVELPIAYRSILVELPMDEENGFLQDWFIRAVSNVRILRARDSCTTLVPHFVGLSRFILIAKSEAN
jgi:hypothetical protein